MALFSAMLGIDAPLRGHGVEARFVKMVEWKRPHFTRIMGSNRAHLEGVRDLWPDVISKVITVDHRSCLYGEFFVLDVDDNYAFDIDEPVELQITYASDVTTPFMVGWDRNGGTGVGVLKVDPDKKTKFSTATLTLDRARFAGQATQGSDIALSAPDAGALVICDLKLTRSNKTPKVTDFGTVKLNFQDENGRPVPARVGLYDASGRAPLANDSALKLQRFADDRYMLAANDRTFWPTENRQIFYADRHYEARVPAGRYELVVGRGIEYKFHRSSITIAKDQVTEATVKLERYADMPASGWYSGDAHIHVTRDEVVDPATWGFISAEDIHVANLLEMGNIIKVYFHQPSQWGKASRYQKDGHALVSGQESPRTGFFGHTIHHNITNPVHLKTEEYFNYGKVFDEIQQQGGTSGFAHMGWGARGGHPPRMNRGLVLLAPQGKVDFIEILQGGRMTADAWYKLLNLGYRVKPAAGTDWPYIDLPGVVRYYVNVGGSFDLDAWYKAYDEGRTFITNGPLLDFTVNGKGVGEELRVQPGAVLDVRALARLNPELDKLDRLELVVLGDVSQTVSNPTGDSIALKTTLKAERSMWVAVRAYGRRQEGRAMTVAHSAPVYVMVGDEPTWKRDAVPQIVAELQGQLKTMLTEPYETPVVGNEPWENRTILSEQWLQQRPLLRPEIEKASAAYQALLDRWRGYARPGS
ncbi:MAG: CehA/McbA family metallohydrolase [Sphingobium sp.]|nr:CehA/McbA family metallohydrolase [Sphingobium sp.]